MKRRPIIVAMIVAVGVLVGSAAQAGKRFRYAEGKHGKGELRYVNGIPVLLVQGSPTEMGEQAGNLVRKPLANLKQQGDRLLGEMGMLSTIVRKTSSLMLPRFPADHLKELDALAKAAGFPRDLLILGNTLPDLRKLHRCSALIVESGRSTTGAPLFGRNLDEAGMIPLQEYTLVTVYRPSGKHAFVSINFPGAIGCFSGMNDAGLALADLTVTSAHDGSTALDLAGTPYVLALRRVLEECATIDEAVRLLRSLRRTTMQNIAICDKRKGAVLEVTTKQIIVRPASDGICCCTNHFRTKELAVDTACPRYKILDTSRQIKRLGLTDIAEKLDAVANDSTLQTMIFEPANLHLHLTFAGTPASQYPLHKLDFSKLFTDGQFPNSRESAQVEPPGGPPRVAKIDKEKYEATFRYRPVGRPHAVYLAGTFNDWKPTALKMTGPDKDGYYQASIPLRAGRYEYKFVVNGKVWHRDPYNDVQAGPYRNSVIEIGR